MTWVTFYTVLVSAGIDDAAMFDIATITDQLRILRPGSGWLMLVDGRQKLNDCDFTNASELLEKGTYCTPLTDMFALHPRHIDAVYENLCFNNAGSLVHSSRNRLVNGNLH